MTLYILQMLQIVLCGNKNRDELTSQQMHQLLDGNQIDNTKRTRVDSEKTDEGYGSSRPSSLMLFDQDVEPQSLGSVSTLVNLKSPSPSKNSIVSMDSNKSVESSEVVSEVDYKIENLSDLVQKTGIRFSEKYKCTASYFNITKDNQTMIFELPSIQAKAIQNIKDEYLSLGFNFRIAVIKRHQYYLIITNDILPKKTTLRLISTEQVQNRGKYDKDYGMCDMKKIEISHKLSFELFYISDPGSYSHDFLNELNELKLHTEERKIDNKTMNNKDISLTPVCKRLSMTNKLLQSKNTYKESQKNYKSLNEVPQYGGVNPRIEFFEGLNKKDNVQYPKKILSNKKNIHAKYMSTPEPQINSSNTQNIDQNSCQNQKIDVINQDQLKFIVDMTKTDHKNEENENVKMYQSKSHIIFKTQNAPKSYKTKYFCTKKQIEVGNYRNVDSSLDLQKPVLQASEVKERPENKIYISEYNFSNENYNFRNIKNVKTYELTNNLQNGNSKVCEMIDSEKTLENTDYDKNKITINYTALPDGQPCCSSDTLPINKDISSNNNCVGNENSKQVLKSFLDKLYGCIADFRDTPCLKEENDIKQNTKTQITRDEVTKSQNQLENKLQTNKNEMTKNKENSVPKTSNDNSHNTIKSFDFKSTLPHFKKDSSTYSEASKNVSKNLNNYFLKRPRDFINTSKITKSSDIGSSLKSADISEDVYYNRYLRNNEKVKSDLEKSSIRPNSKTAQWIVEHDKFLNSTNKLKETHIYHDLSNNYTENSNSDDQDCNTVFEEIPERLDFYSQVTLPITNRTFADKYTQTYDPLPPIVLRKPFKHAFFIVDTATKKTVLKQKPEYLKIREKYYKQLHENKMAIARKERDERLKFEAAALKKKVYRGGAEQKINRLKKIQNRLSEIERIKNENKRLSAKEREKKTFDKILIKKQEVLNEEKRADLAYRKQMAGEARLKRLANEVNTKILTKTNDMQKNIFDKTTTEPFSAKTLDTKDKAKQIDVLKKEFTNSLSNKQLKSLDKRGKKDGQSVLLKKIVANKIFENEIILGRKMTDREIQAFLEEKMGHLYDATDNKDIVDEIRIANINKNQNANKEQKSEYFVEKTPRENLNTLRRSVEDISIKETQMDTSPTKIIIQDCLSENSNNCSVCKQTNNINPQSDDNLKIMQAASVEPKSCTSEKARINSGGCSNLIDKTIYTTPNNNSSTGKLISDKSEKQISSCTFGLSTIPEE